MVNFQVGNLVIYSSAVNQWEQTTPAAGVQSVNGAQGVVIVNAINQLTGDGTAGPASGSASAALTLATVNSNVGTFTNSTVTVDAKGRITAAASGSAPVTSVSVATANGLAGSSSGGPNPILTLSTTVTGILKGDGTTVSAAAPADFPTLNQNTTGTAANVTATTNSTITTLSALSLPGSQVTGNITGNAANVTGTVAIANGGTGQTTQQAALDAIAGATTSGQFLRGNGTHVQLAAIQAGDVPTLNQNTTGTAANVTATTNSTITTLSALSLPGSQVSGDISGNSANVNGTVAVPNGGTALNSTTPYALLTGGTTSTSALQQVSGVGSSGQALFSNGASALPTWQNFVGSTIVGPTISKATASGTGTGGFGNTQQGYLFNITTTSTLAIGDTYTANGNTYTAQVALTAQSGQILFMSGTGSPGAATTLTRATGAGTASITFTNAAGNALNPIPTYLYTTPTSPRTPLYIQVEVSGGGGGGAGNSGAGVNGVTSIFGTSFIFANGGTGGTAAGNSTAGGTSTGSGTGLTTVQAQKGSSGGPGTFLNTNVVNAQGGNGGAGPWGGGGGGGLAAGAGANAGNANSGSGGGGAGGGAGAVNSGAGGAAGGYYLGIITSPAATYLYAVGTGGNGGTTGGQAGGSGVIIVKEYYQ